VAYPEATVIWRQLSGSGLPGGGISVAWRGIMSGATKLVFERAADLGVKMRVRVHYSNYGLSVTVPVTGSPRSIPVFIRKQARGRTMPAQPKDSPRRFVSFCHPVIFARTRFDLIVNQFVLDAFTKRELIIYQRGYSRSFVHVLDTVRGIILGLEAPEEKVRGQVFNLGTPDGNYTKDEIVGLVLKRMPETVVEYKDLTFGGDMRDIAVSFEKIRRELGFKSTLNVDDGVREVLNALKSGLIRDPLDERYRNAQFIVQ
jgi:hypothetical protein